MATRAAEALLSIEARTVRKVRTRIVPFVFLLYLIAFLDRTNIGFAALTMNRDLALDSRQYGFIAGIFFFGYFIFEIPSNLLLHRMGARVWIARILISWGTVAALTGFAQTAVHLYVARFLLGVAEAGFFPGILLYLTYWVHRRELAQTIAIFLSANPVANVVGAPLSGVILDHVHWFGVSSWRWLLILEGIPAIAGGVLTYFLLPSRPAEASFLTAEEKHWVAEELAHEEKQKVTAERITAGRALVHGRVWHLTAAYFAAMAGQYSMIFWMPQLMKSLASDYSNTTVGLLVMVPYLVGLPVMILVGRSSDRTLERRYHAAIPQLIAATSLLVLSTGATTSILLNVALWCLVSSGISCLWGPFWSLPNQFLAGYSAAAAIALINAIGNLGGFVGPYAMGAMSSRTGSFRGGLLLAGAALGVSALLILALRTAAAARATKKSEAIP